MKEVIIKLTENIRNSSKNSQEDIKILHNLTNLAIPDIHLQSSNGEYVKLKRKESFRLIIYCYPMTGRPDKSLPKNWNKIPGAKGCTIENMAFRDNYEELIKLNSLPIGITTQPISEIEEMTKRLKINHDILSDCDLIFTKSLNLPLFNVDNKDFIKRITLVVDNGVIKKVFYPILEPSVHIQEIISWLKKENYNI